MEDREMMEETYETHIVNLYRIGKSCKRIEEIIKNKNSEFDAFFMLDYFDLLLHKKLDIEDKKYTGFLGIEDNIDRAKCDSISDKLLSLYRVSSNQEIDDIFKNDSTVKDITKLSPIPFLGLIQIMINPDLYKHYDYTYEKDLVDHFLTYCEQKIIENIKSRFSKASQVRYQIFRVLTSGNFYLIIRTSSMEDIYAISYIIDTTTDHYNGDSSHVFNMFSTYTNIGIEFGKNADESYKTFLQETIDLCKEDEFALRLTCRNGFQMDLINMADEYKIEGIFGRYDFLLRIGIETFAVIYPYLCSFKLASIYCSAIIPM